jgi:hypothetical protein
MASSAFRVVVNSLIVFDHVCAIPHNKEIFSELENYSHHHDNGNVLNQTSMDIDLICLIETY